MIEFEIPPKQPGDTPLRVILTHEQSNDLRAAHDVAHRMALLASWGGSWDVGERERFADWFTTTGGIHD